MTTTFDPKLHKIVPIEPTDEMLNAHIRSVFDKPQRLPDYVVETEKQKARKCYQAILSAAPEITPNQWHDISTAPKDGQRVLVVIEGANKAILAQKEKDGRWWTVGEAVNWEGKNVTHWMPLPTPPEN